MGALTLHNSQVVQLPFVPLNAQFPCPIRRVVRTVYNSNRLQCYKTDHDGSADTFRQLESRTADTFRQLESRSIQKSIVAALLSFSFYFSGSDITIARPEGVNKPELLPKEFTPVIDVAGFLSEGQERRIIEDVKRLEEDTGFKLRVLAQNYPDTPGLAIKDFWGVDDNTIVFVADPTMGNILNFNVGSTVDLSVPRSFWSRLAGEYGNIFFWREKGEDVSIEAAVEAIGFCLREPPGPQACSQIKT